MNGRQRLQTKSINRAILSLDRILDDNPDLRDVQEMRDRLAARLQTIHAEQKRQREAFDGRARSSFNFTSARRTLRDLHLLPIARKARPLFRHEPKILNALRLPPAHSTPLEHAECAIAMAKALRPHQKFCYTERFEKGFLNAMVDAAKAIQRATGRTEQARKTITTTTRELAKAIADARTDIGIVDAMLKARARRMVIAPVRKYNAPTLKHALQDWAEASKIPKKTGRPKRPKGKKLPPPPPTDA